MNFKKTIFYLTLVIFVFLISEIVNYISNPTSLSSASFGKLFISRSISDAKDGKGSSALFNLSLASRINIYGEYARYRNLYPKSYSEHFIPIEDEKVLTSFSKYLSGITEEDLKLPEDQGLGLIYYNLAVIAHKEGRSDLVPNFLRIAMYNNPEFASFHAELINYYFTVGDMNYVNIEMEYCSKFEEAKTLCGQYKDDSLRLNVAQEVGFMSKEVDRHYHNR